jgi:hypothetical protein
MSSTVKRRHSIATLLFSHHTATAASVAHHPIVRRPVGIAHGSGPSHSPAHISHTHDFEPVRQQRNRPSIADIDDYLRAFAGSENNIVGWQRRGEQTAVGSDLMEAAAIVEPETVKACVRPID